MKKRIDEKIGEVTEADESAPQEDAAAQEDGEREAALAQTLDLYAETGSKARVRDVLFPKSMPKKRPGKPTTKPHPETQDAA